MAKFCEEEVNFDILWNGFKTIYDKYDEIENATPLQGIALALQIKDELGTFIDNITTISFKGLLCIVLESIDIDISIDLATQNITELFNEFDNMEAQIFSINPDDYITLEDLENAMLPIVETFQGGRELLEQKIDEQLKSLFAPLIKIGATEQEIDLALEEVTFEDSPAEYIKDVFIRIAEQTLENVSN